MKHRTRKHAARIIRGKNVNTGEVEAFAYIAGKFYYAGWETGGKFEFRGLKGMSVKHLMTDRCNYQKESMEYMFGKPIKQLLSKSFIHHWETNQVVYGVPF